MRETTLRVSLAVYAGLLVGPLAALLPGPTWLLLAAGCLVGGIAGAVASRRLDLPGSLLTVPRGLGGVFLPLAWFLPAIRRADAAVEVFLSPWFVGVCGSLVWLIALLIAYDARQQARLDALTETVTFEARPPAKQRRQLSIAVGVLVIVSGAAVILSVVLDADTDVASYAWVFGLAPVWIVLLQQQDKAVAVAEEGLRVDQQVHDWADFESYELTDEALRLSRSGWFETQIAFDPADIEDVEAVREALDAHLPRD